MVSACKKLKKKRPVYFTKEETLKVRSDAFPHLAFEKHILKATGRVRKQERGLRIAVMFSGGPASGGHNVLIGLKEMLKGHTLLGVRGGPGGFLHGDMFEIKDISHLENTGGFDFLGTDRTKIKSHAQLLKAQWVCKQHKLDAIVIIGGDDSNTNAAILAEFLHKRVQVIGVPKTMDGDMQLPPYLPITFGFDTATKVYSSLVANLAKDVQSTGKYWHFVRLMGRDASHVTLETALQTQPTMAIISEEVSWEKQSLHHIVTEIAQCVHDRAARGKEYGVVLVPEGLLQAIPEINKMLQKLGQIMKNEEKALRRRNLKRRVKFLTKRLSPKYHKIFEALPQEVRERLAMERDTHGNINVSWIQTEKLLIEMVKCALKKDTPFEALPHFYGYEGRCALPTQFDANLTYNLGLCAGALIMAGETGYMAAIGDDDVPYGIPLVGMITSQERNGEKVEVIEKALVTKKSEAFKRFTSQRKKWREDAFTQPSSGKPKVLE